MIPAQRTVTPDMAIILIISDCRTHIRRMKSTKILALGVIFLASMYLGQTPCAAQNQTPAGRWITANHAAIVQIEPCGTSFCGKIIGIAMDHPNDPMPRDWRGQPQCGLTILRTKQAPIEPGTTLHWVGKVLDPRDGNVYQASISLDTNGHLALHGYLVLPIFGETQTWAPFPDKTPADCRIYPPP